MNVRRFFPRAALCALVSLPLAACQGGGASPPPFFTGVAAPPGQLSASPSAITFSGVGPSFAQTVTVTTSVAVPAINADTSACGTGAAAIVTFGPPSGSGRSFTDLVTPQKAGTCTVAISSPAGGSATVTFIVNAPSVTVSNRRR